MMARAGGVLGRLAAAMVLTLAGAAQAFEPPSWFSGTAEVALPFAATELVPGPDGTLIAVSPEAKAVALVDVATAGLVGVARLAGDPVAVAARSRQRSEPRIAVISRLDSGSYALETLVLGKPGPIGTLAIKLDGRLDGFRAPGLAYVTVAAKRKAENRQLVIWDAAPGAPSDGLFVLQPGKFTVTPLKDLPRVLIPAGGGLLLGVHPEQGLLSIVSPADSDIVDLIAADGLSWADPARIAAFAPLLPEGGSGMVAVANGESGVLTLATVGGLSRPRLDLPLQLPLPILSSGPRPAVAADHDGQFILAGAAGLTELQVVQRLKGGLAAGERIPLDAPLVAMTAVSAPSGAGEDAFAFLTGDGRSVLLSDIPGIEGRAAQAVEFAPAQAGDNAPLAPGALGQLAGTDVQRLQRALGGLGYNVGAIDGKGGPLTETALRAFQLDRGLDPSGTFDQATAAALDQALAQGGQGTNARVAEAFDRVIDTALGRDFDSARLLVLGPTEASVDHPCFGLNDVPPESLWPNAVKFSNLVSRIEGEFDAEIDIVSAYQTEALTRCLGVGAHPLHSTFQAFDIRIAGAEGAADTLAALLAGIEAEGRATLDIQRDGDLVHVSTAIGANLAVIATYGATSAGCEQARGDVAEFARLLAGGDLAGREVLVARLANRDFYTVAVDMNGDSRAADAASRMIASVSGRSGDRRTGADSYVIRNRDLFIDPACAAAAVVPDVAMQKKY